jgi:ABC-type polysaccharide/polyol phosphate transport system ATPase subunit
MVSHSYRTIKQYCDQCAVLRHGKLYYFESVRDAQRMYESD